MTTQMILMVVILLAVTYMFFSPRFPNAVVATIGAVAVGLIGTVQFKSIFTYYAGTSIVLMVGMMIVGGGMFHTGFAGWMGNSIVKLTGKGERSLQIIAILAGGIMSSVCSGSASLMILYPILSSIVSGFRYFHQPRTAAALLRHRLRLLHDAGRLRYVFNYGGDSGGKRLPELELL